MKPTCNVWLDLLANLLINGDLVSPRGQDCLELMGFQSTINMTDPCIAVGMRRLSTQFMAAEAAWILSGDNRVATIAPYAPSIKQFSDDGVTFFGAYGPKIASQLDYVVDSLVKDQFTRQAVMNIWRENPPQTKDFPCTINVQWMIRDGLLHCFDTMRSSDIWLGWPYDVFNFSMLSGLLVIALRERGVTVKLGTLTLTASSQHIYLRNKDRAEECIKTPHAMHYRHFESDHYANGGQLIGLLCRVATKGKLQEGEFLFDL